MPGTVALITVTGRRLQICVCTCRRNSLLAAAMLRIAHQEHGQGHERGRDAVRDRVGSQVKHQGATRAVGRQHLQDDAGRAPDVGCRSTGSCKVEPQSVRCRWRRRWRPCTGRASCTATSRRRTSSSRSRCSSSPTCATHGVIDVVFGCNACCQQEALLHPLWTTVSSPSALIPVASAGGGGDRCRAAAEREADRPGHVDPVQPRQTRQRCAVSLLV